MHILFILLALLLSGCQTGHHVGPVSDHFDGKVFHNPGEKGKSENRTLTLFSVLMAVLQHPWPPKYPVMQNDAKPAYPNGIKVIFINHATVLVQTKTINLLFDPIYSYRASPSQLIGPARHKKPNVRFNDLPNIDVVLISHNHYDHMDRETLKRLDERFQPLFIVPLGNKVLLKAFKLKHVIELDWWDKTSYKNSVITCLPAFHSSQRWFHDYNWTLWASYGVALDGKKLYFAGDTAYSPHFKQIRKRWGKPDLSLLPIGAYQPRHLLKSEHIDPFEAVKSHLDLGSRQSLAIHWGTFQLSSESIFQPIIDLKIALKQLNVDEKTFKVIYEGKPLYLK